MATWGAILQLFSLLGAVFIPDLEVVLFLYQWRGYRLKAFSKLDSIRGVSSSYLKHNPSSRLGHPTGHLDLLHSFLSIERTSSSGSNHGYLAGLQLQRSC